MINPELRIGEQQGGQLSCAAAVLQQKWSQGKKIALPPWGIVFIIGLWTLFFAGCVATAECDEYVGCPDAAVCYQGQCLVSCDDDGDCESQEVCAPCYDEGDDEDGPGRCYGEQGYACVEELDES